MWGKVGCGVNAGWEADRSEMGRTAFLEECWFGRSGRVGIRIWTSRKKSFLITSFQIYMIPSLSAVWYIGFRSFVIPHGVWMHCCLRMP
jgi:hypothetical protein